MGQYYKIVNTTKKEFLHPHKFGDGLKLMEFACSGSATLCGLAILLANSNGRGGGDLHSDNPIVGRWAGDNIVIAGDYAEAGDPAEPGGDNIYTRCREDSDGEQVPYKDISYEVLNAMVDDDYVRSDFASAIRGSRYFLEGMPVELRAKILGEKKEAAAT